MLYIIHTILDSNPPSLLDIILCVHQLDMQDDLIQCSDLQKYPSIQHQSILHTYCLNEIERCGNVRSTTLPQPCATTILQRCGTTLITTLDYNPPTSYNVATTLEVQRCHNPSTMLWHNPNHNVGL